MVESNNNGPNADHGEFEDVEYSNNEDADNLPPTEIKITAGRDRNDSFDDGRSIGGLSDDGVRNNMMDVRSTCGSEDGLIDDMEYGRVASRSVGSASLPDPDEYRRSMGMKKERPKRRAQARSEYTKKRRKKLFLIVVVLALVIAVSVAVGVVVGRQESAPAPTVTGPSSAPTAKYNSKREHIAELASNNGWSDSVAVNQPGTPQFNAAVWLGDEDPLRLNVEDTPEFRERYALAVLFYAWKGNGSTGWYQSRLKWMNQLDVCQWNTQLPTASGNSVTVGVKCQSTGAKRVVGLVMPHIGAESIPDEIALLQDLEELILPENDITVLNPKIADLKRLKDLDVRYNQLEGPFPSFLVFMTSLRSLNLAENKFAGPLPGSLNAFSGLKTLNLGHNAFTGDLSQLGVIQNPVHIVLGNNNFTGVLSDTLLDNWSDLEVLDMNDNQLAGNLPSKLFEHPSLKVIDLHGNSFGGDLPSLILQPSKLEFLALHDNKLTGTMNAVESITSLKHLDLSNNGFAGQMPGFSQLVNLQYLFLSYNTNLEAGPIPESIVKLPNLVDLSLQSTVRTGKIPYGFGDNKQLILLDLGYNQLVDRIPVDLGEASNLHFLLLNQNKLNGTVPEELKNLGQLHSLAVDGNDLAGSSQPQVCALRVGPLVNFIADCTEIACTGTCCTLCCSDGDENPCKDRIYDGNLDPAYVYEYERQVYRLNDKIIYPSPTANGGGYDFDFGGGNRRI